MLKFISATILAFVFSVNVDLKASNVEALELLIASSRRAFLES